MSPIFTGRTIWLNGRFLPMESACISPLDRGFLYGDGLFETIRAEEGAALYLARHIERLCSSLVSFRITIDAPDWAVVIKSLLIENGLEHGPASVKVIVTRGAASAPGLPDPEQPTILVSAQRYEPPAARLYEKGVDLLIHKEGYSPPLAAHKSLNYLYHLAARQAALAVGCHEAVLLDVEGRVSETSAGSLLAMSSGKWWTPVGEYRLPGITIRALWAIFSDAGIQIESREAWPEDLVRADTVWVLNSLMGIMPVAGINGRQLPDGMSGEAARFRGLLFDRGHRDG